LIKKKKKVLARIRRKLKRNHIFNYISRYAGKGVREKMRYLHTLNNRNEIQETLVQRDEIEKKISQHNTAHLKIAHNSVAYKDKIYHRLRENSTRDRILNRTLQREEYDNERVYKLLKLLHQNRKEHYNRSQKEITTED